MEQIRGTITLITGPMFSGKSTELLRLVRKLRAAKKRCLTIVSTIDIRYSSGSELSTHNLETIDAHRFAKLEDIPLDMIDNHDIIIVDEGHFFLNVCDISEEWASQGKDVIIAALNSQFDKEPFVEINKLFNRSDFITHLTATCTKCYKEAGFSCRLSDEKTSIIVGGKEEYEARCRSCYFIK